MWSNDGRGAGWALGEFDIAAAARTTGERINDCMYFSDPYTQPVDGYLEGTPEWKTKWDNQERAPPPCVVRMRASARARQPATQVGGPITACALGGWAVGRTQLEAMADDYPNWTWTIDASYATESDATAATLDGRREARSYGGGMPPRRSCARVALHPCERRV